MDASLSPECNKQEFPEQSAPIVAISSLDRIYINCIDDAIAREGGGRIY